MLEKLKIKEKHVLKTCCIWNLITRFDSARFGKVITYLALISFQINLVITGNRKVNF